MADENQQGDIGTHFHYDADIPVTGHSDVLVVGAGPAGITAAISSARNGAETTLLEKNGYVGGNLTAGLVGPCMTSYSLDGEQQLIKGIFEELVLRMEEMGEHSTPPRFQRAASIAALSSSAITR